jgi:hypothetical protein
MVPEDVAGYLETIWDEAWMYKQGYKFQEKQGNIFEKPASDCEADGFCEVATTAESAIDDGAFESAVVDAELADDDVTNPA